MSLEVITSLPKVQVIYDDSPVSGSAHWDGRDWIIVINGRQREPRRRLALAHEFKHVIDHTTHGFLYTGMTRLSPIEQAERAADHFAGCLLMPRRQVEMAVADGCRTAEDYAQRFRVSGGFATKRLNQLGLAPVRSRQVSLLDSAPEDEIGQADLDASIGVGV